VDRIRGVVRRGDAVTSRAAFSAVLAVGAIGALASVLGGDDGRIVRAEFTNARGLLEGNEVRVQGAPAGTVEAIELTGRNTALVRLRMRDGIPAPRADAAAVIRPVDLLGDVYISLELGTSPQALRRTIATSRTSNAPRLDDLLSAFAPEARDGLRALVVGLGRGLARRGEGVHEAVLRLRPALQATDALMQELDDQRASLRGLVSDAHRATRQLASRRRDLGTTIGALGATLAAVADRSATLDSALRRAPDLLHRLTGTSKRLAQTARAATPLARALRQSAPDLSAAAAALPAFSRDARAAIGDARPLVGDLGATLRAARPGASRLAEGLGALADAAPAVDRLSRALVPAAKPISEGFFVNFADQAAEPGNQPFDPFADPARRYWRGAAVFSCEAFGLPVTSGCLARYLGGKPAGPQRDRPAPATRPAATKRPVPSAPVKPGPALRPAVPALPDLPLGLDEALEQALDEVVGLTAAAKRSASADELLDYLLSP